MTDKEDSFPSLRCVGSSKVETFVKMCRTKLQSLKYGVTMLEDLSNMAASKWCKHLELTLAIY